MKKIFYIGHYDLPESSRFVSLAAINKMDYIINILQKNFDVEIISFATPNIGSREVGNITKIGKNVTLHTFDCYLSKFFLIRYFNKKLFETKVYKYLVKNIKPNDIVIVYHSLLFIKLIKKLHEKIGFKLIYEVEEIYSDVKKFRGFNKKKEIDLLNKLPDSYIFSTYLLNDLVNIQKKPFIEVNGNYLMNQLDNVDFDDNKIHCVYAGTFDLTKGVLNAVHVAKYLSEDYIIHILGFGSEELINKVKEEINNINSISKAKVIYEGLKKGEEFKKFIQKCDIGICPQMIDTKYNSTSFPSKILMYMTNGLKVVSVSVSAINKSKVAKNIIFSASSDSKDMADAIMKSSNVSVNNYSFLNNLDIETQRELQNLINLN